MILDILVGGIYSGYIAGTGDGIVTVLGVPKARNLTLFDAATFEIVQRAASLKTGNYMLSSIDPNKRYLLICRDLPPSGISQRCEPFAWDYIEPAVDLTKKEQRALWESWQI